MENKARYTIVGLFLIIFSIAMVMFVLWQARYSFKEEKKYEYRLYSTTSVAGLKANSFVEYKGLTIGSIKSIDINPKNTEQIEIILEITNPKVIKEDSYATIQSLGITGNKHIQIDGGTQDAVSLIPKDDSFQVIPLKDSFFDTITNQAGDITKNINITLTKVNTLLSQDNIQKIDHLLQNIEDGTKFIEPTFKKINSTLEDVKHLLATNTPKTLHGVDSLTKEWTDLAKQVQVLLNNDVKKLLDQSNKTLQESSGIEGVISNIDNTLDKINTTLDTLNENGGDMIFKTRDVRYGPQEQKHE